MSPFRGFRDMQSEMERMMGEVFGRVPRSTDRTEWIPAIDVTTGDKDVTIRAELPGVKREDVDVTFSLTSTAACSSYPASARRSRSAKRRGTWSGSAATVRSGAA